MTGITETVVAGLIAGKPALFVVPVAPDDAPEALRDACNLRAITVISGVCTCGATVVPPGREARRAAARTGQPITFAVDHRPACPAADDLLNAAIAAYEASTTEPSP